MHDRPHTRHRSALAHEGGCLLCGYSPCTCAEDAAAGDGAYWTGYPDAGGVIVSALEAARCRICDTILTAAEESRGDVCRRHRRHHRHVGYSPWTRHFAVARAVARDWADRTYVGCPGETDYGIEVCCECGGSAVRPRYIGRNTYCSQDCIEQHHARMRKGEVA